MLADAGSIDAMERNGCLRLEGRSDNGAHSVNPSATQVAWQRRAVDEANLFCRVETHGLAEMREHWSRPQDSNQDGLVRITRPASDTSATMKDEGIVQPVSKEMEQLSRRLHQSSLWSTDQRDLTLEAFPHL